MTQEQIERLRVSIVKTVTEYLFNEGVTIDGKNFFNILEIPYNLGCQYEDEYNSEIERVVSSSLNCLIISEVKE